MTRVPRDVEMATLKTVHAQNEVHSFFSYNFTMNFNLSKNRLDPDPYALGAH